MVGELAAAQSLTVHELTTMRASLEDAFMELTGDSEEDRHITVEIDGREILYALSELDQLGHAYALSVHKSQGSEYPAVVVPLVTQHYMLLQRNLLYTAITRGKKLVVLVGSKKALNLAARNNDTKLRWTWLAHRIQDAVAGAPRPA